MTPKTTPGLASYTDADESKVDRAERIIRAELPTGREHATSAKALAAQTPVSASTVRDIIQRLVADGVPIGSKGPGYYRLATRAELDHEITSIEDEIRTREERKAALCRGWNRQVKDDA